LAISFLEDALSLVEELSLGEELFLSEELFFGEEFLLATADTMVRTLYPTEKAKMQAAHTHNTERDGTDILYARILYLCSVFGARGLFCENLPNHGGVSAAGGLEN